MGYEALRIFLGWIFAPIRSSLLLEIRIIPPPSPGTDIQFDVLDDSLLRKNKVVASLWFNMCVIFT